MELDRRVSELLDAAVPAFGESSGDWDAVVRDAGRGGHGRIRRLLFVAGAPAAAVLALAALVLAWPFGGESGGVLERALAAVGDGPVLHVVMQQEWGGTQVDLSTGRRTRIHGEREVWYDPKRGLHSISRFAGVVQSDVVYPPSRVARYERKTFAGLGSGYRKALESGEARVLAPGEVDGIPVYWIRVDAELLPDVADGRLHEWAHDVAVSRETFEPVYTRETRDGKPGPGTAARILKIESLAAGEGDFTGPSPDEANASVFRETRSPLTLSQASRTLRRPALWAGRELRGLPLTAISRFELERGRLLETGRTRPVPLRARQARARVGISLPRRVPVRRTVWDGGQVTGIELLYGRRTTSRDYFEGPWLSLRQIARPHPDFGRGVRTYFPPEGSVLLIGPHIAKLRKGGVYVAIEASGEELILAAARALEPIPASAGSGGAR